MVTRTHVLLSLVAVLAAGGVAVASTGLLSDAAAGAPAAAAPAPGTAPSTDPSTGPSTAPSTGPSTAPQPVDRSAEAAARLATLAAGASADGVSFGVHPDWALDTPTAWSVRTGISPAAYGEFVALPLPEVPDPVLETKVLEVADAGAVLLLTLEPLDGLASVSDDVLADLTATLERWNAAGTPVLVRFGHEMNGSWYPWGQDPVAYVDTFRRTAAAVREAPASQVLWSPNEGGGYPFAGGPHGAEPGSAEHAALDTDGDGALTGADDPFAPYFPGAEHVDWVGLTVYHFGSAYPWGENEVPEDGKLVAKLRGTYAGLGGDESASPDFAQVYAEATGLPLVVSETAALFSTGQDGVGATEQDIKTAWVEQALDPGLGSALPALRLVVWFDQDKLEAETGETTLWSHSRDEALTALVRERVG